MILHGIEAGKEIKLDEAFDKIRTIIENEDGTQTIVEDIVSPFSVYDYISENPQVIVYTESTEDIIVSTTTEQYDLYDEFGNEVEVLYYTDDTTKTTADLLLEANWSPIDELTGDFEVISWADKIDYTRTLEIQGLKDIEQTIVYPIGDISIAGVSTIDNITLTASGNAKIAISFDSGITWKACKNGVWETVDNAHSGMTVSEVNALTSEQITEVRNGSQFIQFSYSLSNDVEIDNISMKVSMVGTERILPSDAYDLSYDEQSKTITYTIKRDCTVSVNYVT